MFDHCNKTTLIFQATQNQYIVKHYRAYPGLEFVVANTLAKWRKLEPNEINLSQGFSQEVVFNS